MGKAPELPLMPALNRVRDLLRSEGLNLPGRDPLLRRTWAARRRPACALVRAQVECPRVIPIPPHRPGILGRFVPKFRSPR